MLYPVAWMEKEERSNPNGVGRLAATQMHRLRHAGRRRSGRKTAVDDRPLNARKLKASPVRPERCGPPLARRTFIFAGHSSQNLDELEGIFGIRWHTDPGGKGRSVRGATHGWARQELEPGCDQFRGWLGKLWMVGRPVYFVVKESPGSVSAHDSYCPDGQRPLDRSSSAPTGVGAFGIAIACGSSTDLPFGIVSPILSSAPILAGVR